jgi:hypothetical protein
MLEARGSEEVAGRGELLMLGDDVLTMLYYYANVAWFRGTSTALVANHGCH